MTGIPKNPDKLTINISPKKHLLVALLFCVVIAVFFNNPLGTGNHLVAGESIYAFYPWADWAGTTQRFQNFDIPLQFYPWRSFLSESLSAGRIPLWNPHVFCGSPFIGNIQTQSFYLPDIPAILISPAHSFLFSAMLKIFLAAFGTWLLALLLGITPVAAFTSGCVFGFSGFMILWLGYPHTTIAAWAPWSLLAAEKLLRKPNRLNGFILAFVTALHMLAGHPEMSTYLLFFTAIYSALRMSQISKLPSVSHKKIAIVLVASLTAGILAAMIVYLPFMEYLTHSMVYENRIHHDHGSAGLPVICLIKLIIPRFFGSPSTGNYILPALKPHAGHYTLGETAAPFFGLWPLFLAVIGTLSAVSRRRHLLALAICGFGTAMLLYGVPGPGLLLSRIPVIGLGFILRTAFIFNLCGALLAGAGFDHVAHLSSKQRLPILLGSIIWVLALTGVVNGLFITLEPGFKQLHVLASIRREINVFTCILCSGAVLLIATALPRLRRLLMILPLVILAELFWFGYGYNALVAPQRLLPAHPAIRYITDHNASHGRVIGLASTLFPNTAMVYGLDDARGYDALTPNRMHALAEAFDPTLKALRSTENPAYMLISSAPPNLLKLMNIRYLMMPPGMTVNQISPGISESALHRQEFPDALRTQLVEYTDTLPRFYTCRDYVIFTDDKAELSFLSSRDFKPGQQVTLEKTVPEVRGSDSDGSFISMVHETVETAHEVTVSAQVSRPAILVSAQPYFPGWQAYVDNEPVELLRCNYAFSGVVLNPGKHRVSFRYEPISYRAGAYISLLMTLIGCWIVGSQARRFRKKQS